MQISREKIFLNLGHGTLNKQQCMDKGFRLWKVLKSELEKGFTIGIILQELGVTNSVSLCRSYSEAQLLHFKLPENIIQSS